MDARFNYMNNAIAAKVAKYLSSAGKAAADSGLPAATRHLVCLLYTSPSPRDS